MGDLSDARALPRILRKTPTKNPVRSSERRGAVNRELVLLYWQIGRDLLARMQTAQWGTGVVKQFAQDIAKRFPRVHSFSFRNLMFMRRFAEDWPDEDIVKQLVS